ncbi:MAG: hypothetical protein ABIT08_04900 [Bacteroidia bacterium]
MIINLLKALPIFNCLFTDYKLNRRVNSVATKHSKYRVEIVDDLNQPVFNASISQDGTTKVETGINGMATLFIKPVAKGQPPVYSFTIKSGDKEIKVKYIQVKKGETVSAKFKLEASGYIVPVPVESQSANA